MRASRANKAAQQKALLDQIEGTELAVRDACKVVGITPNKVQKWRYETDSDFAERYDTEMDRRGIGFRGIVGRKASEVRARQLELFLEKYAETGEIHRSCREVEAETGEIFRVYHVWHRRQENRPEFDPDFVARFEAAEAESTARVRDRLYLNAVTQTHKHIHGDVPAQRILLESRDRDFVRRQKVEHSGAVTHRHRVLRDLEPRLLELHASDGGKVIDVGES